MSQPFHDSASELLGLVAPALRLNPEAVATVARCLEATATLAVKAERAAREQDAAALEHLRRVAFLRPGTTGPEIEKHLRSIVESYQKQAEDSEAAREQAERERDEVTGCAGRKLADAHDARRAAEASLSALRDALRAALASAENVVPLGSRLEARAAQHPGTKEGETP